MDRWASINTLKIGTDIQAFALDLLEFSKQNKAEDLEKYAQKLYDYADEFDIEKMEVLFEDFYNMVVGSEGEEKVN